jgi:hypothetical protein
MPRRRALAPLLALLVLPAIAPLGGCASHASSRTAVRGSSDYITQSEIEATPASNAYDLVNRLRPRWLTQGGRAGSIGGGTVRQQVIAVYLDDVRLGSTEALRSLSTGGFKSLRWYDATRAMAVLRDVPREPIAGAIVITTR